MTDPFITLAGDPTPPPMPRAAFAAELRRRLERELTTDDDDTDEGADNMSDTGYLFYFTLRAGEPDRASHFYRELFGWELHGGDSGFHVNNVYPPMGLSTEQSTDAEVWIEVADVEAAVEQVRALGGRADEPVRYDSGLNAECWDDQGVKFNLIVPTPDYRQGQARSTKPGELFYWTLPAPDAGRSKSFYGELLGWEYADAGDEGGIHVANKLPDGGLGGGREGTQPDLFFRVTDLDEAMAKVAALGGTAESAGEGPEGRHAMCTDDQGTPFGISQPAEGY